MAVQSIHLGGSKAVAPGAYTGEFLGIEATENEFGAAYVWSWKIVGDTPEAGKIAKRYTSQKTGKKSRAAEIMRSMAGLSPDEEADVDVAAMVGQRFHIYVELTESGGSRVGRVSRLDDKVPF
jgi:hypothetical protein